MIIAAVMLMAGGTPSCETALTQAEMNRCAAEDFQAADRALNKQWRIAVEVMNAQDRARDASDRRPGYHAALLAGQRAWLAYRDAHCTSYGYLMRGGSAESMMVMGCKATLTRERTAQLKELAEIQ